MYISNIQSASKDNGCGLFVCRIYEEFHKNQWGCSTCQTPSTIKHVLIECKVFNDTRKHYFHTNTTKD